MGGQGQPEKIHEKLVVKRILIQACRRKRTQKFKNCFLTAIVQEEMMFSKKQTRSQCVSDIRVKNRMCITTQQSWLVVDEEVSLSRDI